MSSEDDKNKNAAGFAGLSSLVSDVEIDADVTKSVPAAPELAKKDAPVNEQKGATKAQETSQPKPTTQTYRAPVQPSDNSGWKWVLGIGAVIAVIWIAGSGNKNQTSPSSYSSSPSAPSYSPPAATPAAPSRLSEELPPVGTNNVLSSAQLRYCLAEDIRLESAKTAVNNYIDSHVDRFNGMVSDYNSRCGQFRYRKGALESARSEVERYRVDLQAEGRGRFSTGTSAAPKSPPQDVKPTPDPIVKSIQQRLNALGYDAGTADGFMGGKTRSAINSFQRDKGLTVDAKPTEALLRMLQASEKPTPKPSSQVQASPPPPAQASPQPPLQAPPQSQYGQIPENASPNRYASQGWSCNSTFKQVGSKCIYIEKPANSSHNSYTPQGWSCNSTFRQVGDKCVFIEKPANSSHNSYTPQGWSCNSTFKQVGNECVYIQKPANSSHNSYTPQGWSCNSGYRQAGSECLR
jgi:hypothetical protein